MIFLSIGWSRQSPLGTYLIKLERFKFIPIRMKKNVYFVAKHLTHVSLTIRHFFKRIIAILTVCLCEFNMHIFVRHTLNSISISIYVVSVHISPSQNLFLFEFICTIRANNKSQLDSIGRRSTTTTASTTMRMKCETHTRTHTEKEREKTG